MLVFSEDRKRFGNTKVFSEFVKELNYLQSTGIELENKIPYGKRYISRVKLIISLFLGDNLGLNTILGFSESFSSNFYGRFCKQHRDVAKILTKENVELLRNPSNYDTALHDFKKTGIKENSVWNRINNFHVTYNYSVDVRHDLLEGVCHYVLIFLLNLFIYEYTGAIEL